MLLLGHKYGRRWIRVGRIQLRRNPFSGVKRIKQLPWRMVRSTASRKRTNEHAV